MSVRCSTCGASLEDEQQLMEHAAKAHPVGTKPLWPPAVANRSSYLRWAALGGLLGGIGMAVVMMIAGQALFDSGIAVVCSMGGSSWAPRRPGRLQGPPRDSPSTSSPPSSTALSSPS